MPEVVQREEDFSSSPPFGGAPVREELPQLLHLHIPQMLDNGLGFQEKEVLHLSRFGSFQVILLVRLQRSIFPEESDFPVRVPLVVHLSGSLERGEFGEGLFSNKGRDLPVGVILVSAQCSLLFDLLRLRSESVQDLLLFLHLFRRKMFQDLLLLVCLLLRCDSFEVFLLLRLKMSQDG